jgi:hypothetical protein
VLTAATAATLLPLLAIITTTVTTTAADITHNSWMLLKWAILIVTVTLITAFTTPVDLAFFTTDGEAYNNRSGFIKYLNILIYALFGVDILVSKLYTVHTVMILLNY